MNTRAKLIREYRKQYYNAVDYHDLCTVYYPGSVAGWMGRDAVFVKDTKKNRVLLTTLMLEGA